MLVIFSVGIGFEGVKRMSFEVSGDNWIQQQQALSLNADTERRSHIDCKSSDAISN